MSEQVWTTRCDGYGRTYPEAQVGEERNGMGGESPVEGAWSIVVSHGEGGRLSVESHWKQRRSKGCTFVTWVNVVKDDLLPGSQVDGRKKTDRHG